MKEKNLKINGLVVGQERNFFLVETDHAIVRATISGKIRNNKIRIVVGDTVEVEVSPYDLERGRITRREE